MFFCFVFFTMLRLAEVISHQSHLIVDLSEKSSHQKIQWIFFTFPLHVKVVLSPFTTRCDQASGPFSAAFSWSLKVSGVPFLNLVIIVQRNASDKNTSPATSKLRLLKFLCKKWRNQQGHNKLVILQNNYTTAQVSDMAFIPVSGFTPPKTHPRTLPANLVWTNRGNLSRKKKS